MQKTLLPGLAWLLLFAVAFVTLSPIGLRPNSGLPANAERLIAFLFVGAAFALAYPRHLILIAFVVLGAAVGLELLQYVAQGRHPRLRDMGFKFVGGGLGVLAGAMLTRLALRLSPRPEGG